MTNITCCQKYVVTNDILINLQCFYFCGTKQHSMAEEVFLTQSHVDFCWVTSRRAGQKFQRLIFRSEIKHENLLGANNKEDRSELQCCMDKFYTFR